jgi:hypothetical protein
MSRLTRKKDKVEQKVTRNCEEMLPFVQIPEKGVRELALSGVKTLTLRPKFSDTEMSKKEGTHFNEKDVDTIYDEDVDVYVYSEKDDKEPHLLARFRKNVIDHDLIKEAWCALYKTAAPSRNRGAAAGPIAVKGKYWLKRNPKEITGWSAKYMQNGKLSKMRVNNNVYSSVLGFFEATPFMGLPCRLTSYTQKYFKEYKAGITYIQGLDSFFKKLTPEAHSKQLARAKKNPTYQIDGTAYSSVTVNRNFRTALHKDAGDFREGFGNLSVLEYGDYSGGYTLFPRYGIGFNMRTGDYLAMNVHEWHCNTEMYETEGQKKYNKTLPKIYNVDPESGTLGQDKPFTRISFVCYLREKLHDCKPTDTNKYYSRIGFNPVTGPRKIKGTRKNKKSRTGEDSE